MMPRLHEVFETKLESARVMICIDVTESAYGTHYTFFVLDDGHTSDGSPFRIWVESHRDIFFGAPGGMFDPGHFNMSRAFRNFAFVKLA